jgi:hypothetical protein
LPIPLIYAISDKETVNVTVVSTIG